MCGKEEEDAKMERQLNYSCLFKKKHFNAIKWKVKEQSCEYNNILYFLKINKLIKIKK